MIYRHRNDNVYDSSIVAYKTGAEQTVNLVLATIRLAMRKEKRRAAAELQLHSGHGFQYTSQAYFIYNHERIQLKTGVAPLTLRHSAKTLYFPTLAPFALTAQSGAVQCDLPFISDI